MDIKDEAKITALENEYKSQLTSFVGEIDTIEMQISNLQSKLEALKGNKERLLGAIGAISEMKQKLALSVKD
jgi:prefoldin subunit 5